MHIHISDRIYAKLKDRVPGLFGGGRKGGREAATYRGIRIPVFIVSFLQSPPRPPPQGSDLPKLFPKSVLAHTATVLSYNMALIITSIKTINPSYFTIVCAHPGSATC